MVHVCLRSVLAMLLWSSGAAFAHPADAPAAGATGPRVRGATPQMTRVIEAGIRRSPTFAALVAALNRTEVIVYVQGTRDLPPGVDGQLAVTGSAGPQRYLRAQVMAGLDLVEMIAVVAHELQHALEVAEHEEVRDAATLAALYARIGIGAPRGRYDTSAAQAAGGRVRAELG